MAAIVSVKYVEVCCYVVSSSSDLKIRRADNTYDNGGDAKEGERKWGRERGEGGNKGRGLPKEEEKDRKIERK